MKDKHNDTRFWKLLFHSFTVTNRAQKHLFQINLDFTQITISKQIFFITKNRRIRVNVKSRANLIDSRKIFCWRANSFDIATATNKIRWITFHRNIKNVYKVGLEKCLKYFAECVNFEKIWILLKNKSSRNLLDCIFF